MHLSDNMRGALLMMGSLAAFTINDVMMKALAGQVPLMQALFIRGVMTVVLMIGLAAALGQLRFRFPRRDWGISLIRTFCEIGAAYFFLHALFNMPIANVTAVLQVLPLTVTLAGALFLGEHVGWRRAIAIAVGFIGVILIVRPGPEGFNTYAIYALITVGFITLRDIVARRLSHETPSLMVAVIAASGVTIFAGVMSAADPDSWVTLTGTHWLLLIGCALFILLAYTMSVSVMRVGEIAVIMPFRYSGLICALILGFVVFGDWPDPITLLGAAIVVATGVFSFYREHVLAKAAKA